MVVILDVGTSMCQESTEKLESAIETVNLLLQQKILFKPKDQVGLVLFGSTGKWLVCVGAKKEC